MRIAIMQPYFLPYIGYWQLIGAVDVFVVYDNIKYTKKGWINRNRFLLNRKEAVFSLPLRKDSDFLDVKDRFLAPSFNRDELLNRFREAYRKAPKFTTVVPITIYSPTSGIRSSKFVLSLGSRPIFLSRQHCRLTTRLKGRKRS